MGSRFLTGGASGGSAEVIALLNTGSETLNVASIIDQGLVPNQPVKTNANKELISGLITTSDINFSVLTNPYVGTLTVSDLETDDYKSIDTILGEFDTQTQNIAITTVAGNTDWGNTDLSNINVATSTILTSGRLNLIQQASMGTPAAGRDILWSLTTDGRLYTTNPAGVANRIAFTGDAPGGGGTAITNGTGESVIVNANGSILYDGGCVEYVATATGSGAYMALPGQKNIIVDLVAITSVSLPVSPIGTVYYVRREYALQGGEVWPASVFSVSAVGSTIEGSASLNITAFAGARLLFIGTKWVVC